MKMNEWMSEWICQIKTLIHMCEAVFCNLEKGRLSLFEIICHLLKIIFIYLFF